MKFTPEYELVKKTAEIYEQQKIADTIGHLRETVNRWLKGKLECKLTKTKYDKLEALLPKPPNDSDTDFTFIDLFAGIGGIRKGFENSGGRCVFTSEKDRFAVRTYRANYYSGHEINGDIQRITQPEDIQGDEVYDYINNNIPDHDVLLAGFPCQPFSIAGVSKKNSLGRKHGFECKTQGTLFFDVARILRAKMPPAFMLENVKNLKSHNKGHTFKVILETLDEIGYAVADSDTAKGEKDPKIIDGQNFVPQHRERIILAGVRKDLGIHKGFTLRDIKKSFPDNVPSFSDILEPEKAVPEKYILTENLWKYLQDYAAKHKAKGNGFGYSMTYPDSIARTLSARYHKDGSEILIYRGKNKRPRRLTPRECARLMGFDSPQGSSFSIPVSDTQAYRQFGNSVVVPVFDAVAKLMKPHIIKAKKVLNEARLAG